MCVCVCVWESLKEILSDLNLYINGSVYCMSINKIIFQIILSILPLWNNQLINTKYLPLASIIGFPNLCIRFIKILYIKYEAYLKSITKSDGCFLNLLLKKNYNNYNGYIIRLEEIRMKSFVRYLKRIELNLNIYLVRKNKRL